MRFRLEATSGSARAGVLFTPHGAVSTPAFLPAATYGNVKTLTSVEVEEIGVRMLLANAYHLYLRPGIDAVASQGGLHTFMHWQRPILTDSGGFQAFSLGSLRQVQDDGIWFQSHIDGSRHFFSPEEAIVYQESLGADVIMCLDHCIAYGEPEEDVGRAMERTHRWAERCKSVHSSEKQALFGIVQGGVFPGLREESARFITSLSFNGYAIGGLAVGESKKAMYQIVSHTEAHLPKDQPRYLMGVGAPDDLVGCVALGIDLFDCALPTRVARNGALFTRQGRIDITNARNRGQDRPVEEGCDCPLCRSFPASYLHHLFKVGETLGLRLATLHNLRFVTRLMEEMRQAILQDTFLTFRERFASEYIPTNEATRLTQKEKWMDARGARGQAVEG